MFLAVQVDATTNDNYSTLHIAMKDAKSAVIKTVLEFEAEVHIRGEKRNSSSIKI